MTWALRLDVAANPNVGGDYKPPAPPISGAIASSEGAGVEVQVPAKPGKYRLFVHVHDGRGNAATANVPILAEESGNL